MSSPSAGSRELDGKVALITGAGSGIGYVIAERFAHEGAAAPIEYLGHGEDAQALARDLRDRVRFVGEVGGSLEHSLFADARALLMPIRGEEPFGMVMVEALACGTPVLAVPEGAACELVVNGVTGFLVYDESEMSAAVDWLPRIEARNCRARVSEHCASMWSPRL